MISAGVYLFGSLIYWMWATGELQPWAQKSLPVESNNKTKPQDSATYVGYANEGLEMSE